jgi:hypothetical protein
VVSARPTRVLLADPDLADGLEGDRRRGAIADCIARVLVVAAGEWPQVTRMPPIQGGIGLLVLDGLITRRVGLEGRFGAELLGTGDLLRPWEPEGGEGTLPHERGWRVLHEARLAVLDRGFAMRLTRYPEVTSALFGRAIQRSRHLALNMAIVHQPRVDVRLHMLFWDLADRWGTVGRDGVRVPLRLTHTTLSELVAARRPTVTSALAELAETGRACWDGEAWLLAGEPPHELRELTTLQRPAAEAADRGLRASER